VEVLILNGLRKVGIYKVVTRVGLKILVGLRDRAAEAHYLREHGQIPCPKDPRSITYWYRLSSINCKSFVGCELRGPVLGPTRRGQRKSAPRPRFRGRTWCTLRLSILSLVVPR